MFLYPIGSHPVERFSLAEAVMASQTAQEIWVPAIQPPQPGVMSALRRRWRLVALSIIASLAVGAAIAVHTEPQYSANARIRLLGERSMPMVADSHSAAEDAAAIRAQYYVLRSPRILGMVADRLNLPQRWNTDQRAAAQRLEQMVQPRRLLDVNVTELKVVSPDAQLAADVANSVVDVYIQQANQPHIEQAQLALSRLRNECESQEKELAKAGEQVELLRREMGLEVGQGQIASNSLNPLRQMLAQDEAALIDAQIKADMLARSSDDALLTLQSASSSDAVARQISAGWIEGEYKLAEMEQRYGHDHPLVQAKRAQLEQINGAALMQVQRMVQLAGADKAAAEVRVQHDRQRLAEAESTLVSAGGSYGQLLAAEQKQDVIKSLLKLLTERTQKLEVDLSIAGPAAEVIELASAPAVPELGTPLQMMLMALAVGLVAGIIMAVGVDRLDDTIRDPEEVEWQLNMQLMGIVAGHRTTMISQRDGQGAEAYRMIRNSIDFADHTMRSLCVTAATSHEGASATAANLAWTWAEHGARVLLVDADLQQPRLHTMLGVGNEQGLIDHLATNRSLDDLTIQTSVPNLSILPAGTMSKQTGLATLTPQQLSQLLIWARSRADIIIIDTGPLLQSSDAALVARQSDATILVARQRRSRVRDLRRSVHLLKNCGEGLLGMVLTGVSANASWDPMPTPDSPEEEGQSVVQRSVISRTRKRNRHAA
ncbi:MAG TPA: polysaccharide biosynthesis tyrosine autokinase [Tepidisphaeraceae bacterium]|nr:polysaccharide biosynthesis tyrosine autokinase [Tepidisphaeraceae bacterium]